MADAKICDRCGEVVRYKDTDNERKVYVLSLHNRRFTSDVPMTHLCEGCATEMQTVISRFLETPRIVTRYDVEPTVKISLGMGEEQSCPEVME